MAIDLQQVSAVDVEPGELPATMAAWVIREERFGEPKDAFQIEEIEVPEPGAFEVIVRVMAAGVNYNNVWAALGKPVSVFNYQDHPEFGHHIGGSDASGIVWKVGSGSAALSVAWNDAALAPIAAFSFSRISSLSSSSRPSSSSRRSTRR